MFLDTYGCLISWPDFGLLLCLCRSEQEQHKLKAVSTASFLMKRNLLIVGSSQKLCADFSF
jgi:hypothetical protein